MSDRLPIPIAGWRFTQAGPVTRAGWARGVILSSGTAQFVPTEKGVAYYNDGVADASPVVSGGESEVQITGPFTFAAWIYIDAYSSADGHTVMSIVGDPNGETEPDNFLTNITLRSDAVGQFHEYGGGTNEIVSAAVPGPSAGAWHHFVFVRDSANKVMEWWWDGELRASASYNNEPTGGQNALLCIGEARRSSANAAFIGEAWDGYIVDPVVWDQALARAEIERLHLLHGELFMPARWFVPAQLSNVVQLAAATTAVASAQSAFAVTTQTVPLSGQAASTAAATASLTVATQTVPLSGQAASTATAASSFAVIGASPTITAAASASAAAQATLTARVQTVLLSGQAAASATAAATPTPTTVAVDMAGSAAAVASGAAALAPKTLTTSLSATTSSVAAAASSFAVLGAGTQTMTVTAAAVLNTSVVFGSGEQVRYDGVAVRARASAAASLAVRVARVAVSPARSDAAGSAAATLQRVVLQRSIRAEMTAQASVAAPLVVQRVRPALTVVAAVQAQSRARLTLGRVQLTAATTAVSAVAQVRIGVQYPGDSHDVYVRARNFDLAVRARSFDLAARAQ